MFMSNEYRIVEVSNLGKIWWEVQQAFLKSDFRNETYKEWRQVEPKTKYESLNDAREKVQLLKQAVRVERVVE